MRLVLVGHQWGRAMLAPQVRLLRSTVVAAVLAVPQGPRLPMFEAVLEVLARPQTSLNQPMQAAAVAAQVAAAILLPVALVVAAEAGLPQDRPLAVQEPQTLVAAVAAVASASVVATADLVS